MPAQFKQILTLLCDAGADFIVVGGVAMTTHGSAYITYDLDICYSRSPVSIRKLCLALKPVHPRLRGAPDDLPFLFDERTVSAALNFTLATDLGDLDLLGELAGIGKYEQVLPHSVKSEPYGIPCRILSIQGLIQSKKTAGRKKDLDAIPELEAMLDLQRRIGGKPDA
jgi:hypothetical protein